MSDPQLALLRDVLVIEPGHGSVWLHDVTDADLDGRPAVSGWTLDEGGVGSSLMPDDFRGERITLTYPTSLIRKEVFR